VYTRVYDLASAFDTVEFSVLLEKLFNVGIRGKSWRFVLWSQPSEVGKSAVKFLQYLLNPPELCTLSLIFFILIIDPLLFTLKPRNLGLNVNGLFLGVLAHTNDIRSSAANIEDSAEQVAMVDSITTTKSLKLTPEKCALLSTNNNIPYTNFSIRIGETCLPMEKSVKCLGVWWDSSPPASSLYVKE